MMASVRAISAMRGLAVLLAAGAAGGCLTPEPRHYVPGPALAKELQCQTQRVTGELVASRVCTFKGQRDAQEQGAQDARDFLTRQPVFTCPGAANTLNCKN